MSHSDKTEWYKNYAAHVRGDPPHIMAIERMIVRLMNNKGVDRDGAIEAIFLTGVSALLEDPEVTSSRTKEQMAAIYEVEELKATKRHNANLHVLYEELGTDDFIVWCDKHSIDPKPTMESYSLPPNLVVKQDSQKARMFAWLIAYLHDKKDHKTEDIIKDAVSDGLLPDPLLDKDEYVKAERSFRSLASEKGFSSLATRGFWRIPENIDTDIMLQ